MIIIFTFIESQITHRPVDGFVLGGFHFNGPTALKIDTEEVAPIFKELFVALPGKGSFDNGFPICHFKMNMDFR
jgi:hypothetical protein